MFIYEFSKFSAVDHRKLKNAVSFLSALLKEEKGGEGGEGRKGGCVAAEVLGIDIDIHVDDKNDKNVESEPNLGKMSLLSKARRKVLGFF